MTHRWVLVAPKKPLVTQAWLHNHALAIRDSLAATATYETPSSAWFDDLDNVPLGHRWCRNSYGLGRLARATAGASARRQLQALDTDAVIVHFANLFDLVGGRRNTLPDVPTIVYVHGYDITWSPLPWCPVPYKNFANTRSYQRRLVAYAERVVFVANSEHSRRALIDIGVPQDRVQVCYLPVPYDSDVTASVGNDLDERVLRLLYLGRFVGFKGPVEVVRAVRKSIDKGARVHLEMIGDGPLFAQAKQLVADLKLDDVVDLRGAVANTVAMQSLERADALILHNQTDTSNGQVEAFGYAHAEALVRGVPVLTARSGGPAEFLEHNVSGLMVEPGDIDAQADAIVLIANDRTKRDELSRGACSAGKRFSPANHYTGIERAILAAAK